MKWRTAYRTDHERTLNDVAARSDDAGRADTRPVRAGTAVLTVDHVTSVNRAVGSDEARRTRAVPGTVTRCAVTTSVEIAVAVQLGTGATGVAGRACAAVAVDQVVARSAI